MYARTSLCKSRLVIMISAKLLVLSACAHDPYLYTSTALGDPKKFEKVLVLAEATAGYGKVKRKGFTFCQASSRRIMERYINSVKPWFTKNGYNVVDVIPVGLNFMGPSSRKLYPEPHIVEDFESAEKRFLPAKQDQYVYMYNNMTVDERAAIVRLNIEIEKIEIRKARRRIYLNREDLRIIAEKRGADAICFTSGYGYYETVGPGDVITSIVTGALSGGLIGTALFPIGCIPNRLESFTVYLIDARSGEVLFSNTHQVEEDDKNFEKAIDGALSKLPPVK